jgi:hypothetical protein
MESRSTRHCGHQWPIVPAPGDYDDGVIGGMIGRGNRSTRRKLAPVRLCPPQSPHAARTRTRAAAVGSQLLTAWATARPCHNIIYAIYRPRYFIRCFLKAGFGACLKYNVIITFCHLQLTVRACRQAERTSCVSPIGFVGPRTNRQDLFHLLFSL